MNTTKHTPGPWVYRGRKHSDWGEINDAAGECVIASCNSHISGMDLDACRRTGVDPAGANARLIAAAPELLAALEEYVAQDFWACGYDSGIGGNTQSDAEAAIAKAKGEGA